MSRIIVVKTAVLLGLVVLAGGCAHQDVAGLYVDAVVLNQNGQVDEAAEKLNAVVKAEPRFSPAHSLLGNIYQQAGEYEKSAEAYEKAAQINRWSFRDFFNLGAVYQIMERFAEAVEAYVVACRLKPEHFQAHFSAAKCYSELAEYDEALRYARAAKVIDPNVSEVEKFLGGIYETTQDYEQAIASYRRALELQGSTPGATDAVGQGGNDPNIMMPLAVMYLKSKQPEPARELLREVVEVEPDNGLAYYYLGYCYLKLKGQYTEAEQKLGQIEKAIESYRRAIQINDEDWMAHKGLGVAYMIKVLSTKDDQPVGSKAGQLKATAIKHWEKSLEIKPDQVNNEKLRKLVKVYSR